VCPRIRTPWPPSPAPTVKWPFGPLEPGLVSTRLRDPRDLKEIQDLLELIQQFLAPKEIPDRLDHKGQLDRREARGPLDRKEQLDRKEIRDPLDRKGQLGRREARGPLDRKEQLDRKEIRDPLDRKGQLGRKEQLDRKDQLDRKEVQGRKAIQDHKDRKEALELQPLAAVPTTVVLAVIGLPAPVREGKP
jgi:hypothetical protein